MRSLVIAALVGGVFLVIAALLFAGRYSMTSTGFIYDRFTGEVRRCGATCRVLPNEASTPATTQGKTGVPPLPEGFELIEPSQ